jgi:hypothetical protein
MWEFFDYILDHIIYEYGECKTDKSSCYRVAKRHRRTGSVLFILWKAGQHGHKKPYWIEYDSYWWKNFRRTDV